MDKMYAEIVFETGIPIANPENLIVSLDTIEFMVPELLRLDFSTIRTKIYTTSITRHSKLTMRSWRLNRMALFTSILNHF